jgi:hypothetical protein
LGPLRKPSDCGSSSKETLREAAEEQEGGAWTAEEQRNSRSRGSWSFSDQQKRWMGRREKGSSFSSRIRAIG